MNALKRGLSLIVCLLPLLLTVIIILWRTVSDPRIISLLNNVFYGFIVAISVTTSVFVFIFVVNCTNRAFHYMFGKPVFKFSKDKEN